MRTTLFLLSCLACSVARPQQFNLDWATEVPNGVVRVKFASNGDLFALSTGSNNVRLERFNGTGSPFWTTTLSAPGLTAIDMDVDGSDNVYVYLGFTTGQLDLDPGPFTTLVNPGKVYAKYNASGQFLWGFSIENSTDLSESYGGVSCDDAGNLYIAGNLGQGTYDMDPGPGVYNLVVGPSTTGVFLARYRAVGSLHWADVRQWANGFNYTRAIAAMRNGAGCYVVQRLDNGGPLSGQIDVDPGPGTFNVPTQSMNLLRYDSTFAFVARAGIHFGEQRLAADNAGNAYLMARAYAGAGFWALKYSTSGQALNEIYETSLPTLGNTRLASIVPDGQGGSMGSYSVNCSGNSYRFFKMNVSGLVDFNFQLYSGTDCTYPIARGFAVRGATFAVGSFNQNYPVDFDPGSAVLSLPTGNNDGVVALYNWCGGAPFAPFGVDVLDSAWCVGDTVPLAVDAFGDAASYTWDAGTWTLAAGQGDSLAYMVAANAGPAMMSVSASNACGNSSPVSVQLTAGSASATLPADSMACFNLATVLDPGPCPGCTFLWEPGGATTATLPVDITETTTFIVTATQGTCSVTDSITLTIDNCTAIDEAASSTLHMAPVPVLRGQPVTVSGLDPESMLRLVTMDGRPVQTEIQHFGDRATIATDALPLGTYLVHVEAGHALRLVVQ